MCGGGVDMKASEVGFDGDVQIFTSAGELTVRFARAVGVGLDRLPETKNYNINGQVKNTLIWHDDGDPELLYRGRDGRLYRVAFEEISEKL